MSNDCQVVNTTWHAFHAYPMVCSYRLLASIHSQTCNACSRQTQIVRVCDACFCRLYSVLLAKVHCTSWLTLQSTGLHEDIWPDGCQGERWMGEAWNIREICAKHKRTCSQAGAHEISVLDQRSAEVWMDIWVEIFQTAPWSQYRSNCMLASVHCLTETVSCCWYTGGTHVYKAACPDTASLNQGTKDAALPQCNHIQAHCQHVAT